MIQDDLIQDCGSAFIFCGSGSGSSCSSQCGSGSGCFFKMRIRAVPYEEFYGVKKTKKIAQSKKIMEFFQIYLQLRPISLPFFYLFIKCFFARQSENTDTGTNPVEIKFWFRQNYADPTIYSTANDGFHKNKKQTWLLKSTQKMNCKSFSLTCF